MERPGKFLQLIVFFSVNLIKRSSSLIKINTSLVFKHVYVNNILNYVIVLSVGIDVKA